jgi:hypothetical protein
MVKRKSNIRKHSQISDEAIAAWQSGDVWGLQAALGLKPWHHGVLPPEYASGYCLPDEPDHGDLSARGWHMCKQYQQQLIELVGLPALSVKRAACEKRLADAEASLAYLLTPMARNMEAHGAHALARHEERISETREQVAALKACLEALQCAS